MADKEEYIEVLRTQIGKLKKSLAEAEEEESSSEEEEEDEDSDQDVASEDEVPDEPIPQFDKRQLVTVTFKNPGSLGLTYVPKGKLTVVGRVMPGSQAQKLKKVRPGFVVVSAALQHPLSFLHRSIAGLPLWWVTNWCRHLCSQCRVGKRTVIDLGQAEFRSLLKKKTERPLTIIFANPNA